MKYAIYVKSKNIEMCSGHKTEDTVDKLLQAFLENYEREQNILRNESNFILDIVDVTLIQFRSIDLKRDSSYIPSPK